MYQKNFTLPLTSYTKLFLNLQKRVFICTYALEIIYKL